MKFKHKVSIGKPKRSPERASNSEQSTYEGNDNWERADRPQRFERSFDKSSDRSGDRSNDRTEDRPNRYSTPRPQRKSAQEWEPRSDRPEPREAEYRGVKETSTDSTKPVLKPSAKYIETARGENGRSTEHRSFEAPVKSLRSHDSERSSERRYSKPSTGRRYEQSPPTDRRSEPKMERSLTNTDSHNSNPYDLEENPDLIYGRHAVSSAIAEGGRSIHRIWITPKLRYAPDFTFGYSRKSDRRRN